MAPFRSPWVSSCDSSTPCLFPPPLLLRAAGDYPRHRRRQLLEGKPTTRSHQPPERSAAASPYEPPIQDGYRSTTSSPYVSAACARTRLLRIGTLCTGPGISVCDRCLISARFAPSLRHGSAGWWSCDLRAPRPCFRAGSRTGPSRRGRAGRPDRPRSRPGRCKRTCPTCQ